MGYLIAAAAFGLLFSHLGWRGLFLLGASPALLVFYIRTKVEESPVWKQHREQGMAHTKPSLSALLTGVLKYAPAFLFVVLMMTAFNSFSHGTQDLYPTFLQKDWKMTAGMVGVIGVIYNIGALAGGMVFGYLSEQWGRKRAIIVAALLSIPVIPLFAFGRTPLLLAIGSFLMQFMVQGAWGVVPAYLAELSPGPVRATFPGLAYQLGNLISSKNSVLQSWIAERIGRYAPVLAGTVLIVALMLALIVSFGRESRGEELA